MRKMFFLVIIIASIALSAFVIRQSNEPVPIPASLQRTGGNAVKGYQYLTTGDYIKSGIPYQVYLLGAGADKNNYLRREGLNKNLSHEVTAVKTLNGEVVVAPNCLSCHAQVFDGELIIGLGNSMADFTKSKKLNAENLAMLEKFLKAQSPKQYQASYEFIRAGKAISEKLHAPIKGVNVAGRLAALLVAHRNSSTLQWSESESLEIPKEVVISDTPPWWLLKKKNAMFYNGFGRGDFGRFLMASNLFTVSDTTEARMVDEHMPDVLTYIYSLEPPRYPKPVNNALVSKGKALFGSKCSGCHGTYGEKETYPNYLIPASLIGTDSALYKSNYSNPQFVNWFNKSWFTKGDHPAKLQPFEGYIAPPLDGIWISAPYLHNGSVPTLETLLNSKLRPAFWSRDFDKPQYNYEQVGWTFTEETKGDNPSIYNTTLPGYGNYGHYFGDALSEQERKAVIEYLKTL